MSNKKLDDMNKEELNAHMDKEAALEYASLLSEEDAARIAVETKEAYAEIVAEVDAVDYKKEWEETVEVLKDVDVQLEKSEKWKFIYAIAFWVLFCFTFTFGFIFIMDMDMNNEKKSIAILNEFQDADKRSVAALEDFQKGYGKQEISRSRYVDVIELMEKHFDNDFYIYIQECMSDGKITNDEFNDIFDYSVDLDKKSKKEKVNALLELIVE